MVLEGEELPNDLKEGHISALFKKGDKKDCCNYRGICGQSAVSRVIGRLLKEKVEAEYVTPEEQTGFTAGRSSMDNIFVLRQVMEKSQERNRELHLAFIDLEQDYDSDPRKLRWRAAVSAQV